MNSKTFPYGNGLPTCVSAAAALLLSVTVFAAAMAGQPAGPGDIRSENVSLAGLDLATPEGLSAARERVHQTARRLCWRLADSADLSRQTNYVACVDDAVASAMLTITGLAPGLLAQSPAGRRSLR